MTENPAVLLSGCELDLWVNKRSETIIVILIAGGFHGPASPVSVNILISLPSQ